MFGASALKLVKYFIKGGTFGANEVAILGVGCVVAFVVSLIAIKWLMGFVRRHDFKCFSLPHHPGHRGACVLLRLGADARPLT